MEIAPAAPLTLTTPAPSVPTVTSGPPAVVAPLGWPSNWVNTWIPLEGWGKYNRLGKLTQVTAKPAPVFQLRTTNGAMFVQVGSRLAYCNGLECWLGYAPQLIKGVPYVHAIDAQKNLQPLLSLASYRFKIDRTIAIDPGHGGVDSGARSVANDRFEKEYTLDWAQRLSRLLATNRWKVVLTRTGDADVPLHDRVAVAERADADLFLSLHFNSALPNRELAGVETYCLTPTGMPSSLVRTYEDDMRQVYPNNAYDKQNFQVAVRLHRSILQSTSAADRGVRRARFMGVLRGQNRPAVLIEGGYLSNPKEARKIATADYRQTLAEAVARALD
jgi:N-acetylmuramoyl-L-alanine amidase